MSKSHKPKLTNDPNGRTLIDPNDPALMMDEKDNTRAKAYTKAEIKQRADTLLKDGQLQPVEVREQEDGSLRVTFGVGRLLGCRHLVEQGHKQKLWIVIREATEEEAFLRSVKENLERKGTTPIDDAYNIKKLITPVEEGGFGYTQKQASEVYRCTPANVSQKLKLLTLSPKIQNAISSGKLSMKAGLDLAAIEDEKEREKAFEASLESAKAGNNGSRRANSGSIREARRNAARASRSTTTTNVSSEDSDAAEAILDAPSESVDTPPVGSTRTKKKRESKATRTRTVQRDIQEVREFFQQYADPATDHPGILKDFAEDMLQFLSGELEDGDLQDSLLTVYAYYEPEPIEE